MRLFFSAAVATACFFLAAVSGFAENTETVVYRFKNVPDGSSPGSNLIDVGGTLYGTTGMGGAHNAGTVFSVTTAGVEKVIYSFAGGSDGATPAGGLVEINGTLYGATAYGGGSGCSGKGCGTVYSVTTAGVEKVLYSFAGNTDGANPFSSPVAIGNTLYGTTIYGGDDVCATTGCGTLYSVTTKGHEQVLHTFHVHTIDSGDGVFPMGSLVVVGNMLYGTTDLGGANNDGAVFSATRTGAEQVVYSFAGGSDGTNPQAGLIEVDNRLYGTTSAGGGSGCYSQGCGTVFSVTRTGVEKVLHSFVGGNDGSGPTASLVDVGGALYGTTQYGGRGDCFCGTVFTLTTTGHEKVLFSFNATKSGALPLNSLVDVGGLLYGTASEGGAKYDNGLVFSMTP